MAQKNPGTPFLPDRVARALVCPKDRFGVSHLPGTDLFAKLSGVSKLVEENFKKKEDRLNFLGNFLKNISLPLGVKMKISR
jgi:hypothetical protein